MPSHPQTSSNKLHRSKSTTSVKERRKHPIPSEPQDPDASRVHALIAAHRAMDRSQSRSSGELQQTDSNSTVKQHVQFSPATQLCRQRSVLQNKAPHLAAALSIPEETRRIRYHTEADPSEFGSVNETYGAEPSSYRKVRRTKSMATPRRRLFTPSSPRTPLSQAPTLRHTSSIGKVNVDVSPEPGFGLRIRKSFNFLRPASRLTLNRRAENGTAYHDDAVLLAQAQYLDCVPHPQPKIHAEREPSLIFQKIRRPQKAFRRSVRTTIEEPPISSSASVPATVDTSLSEPVRRSFSATMRSRFMKVFGKSTSSRSIMPPQQLEATRRHFNTDLEEHDHSTSFDDYHLDENNERRQSFYVPTSTPLDPDEELDRLSPTFNPTESGDSLHSTASRSRVTSWANSSSTGSSALRTGGLERNRLSIIKEDGGPHQPSSSAGRHLGGISMFQDPLPDEYEDGRPIPPIDSQRIYSALMRRISEEEAEMEETRAALEEIHNSQEINRDDVVIDAGKSTIRAVSRTTRASSAEEDEPPVPSDANTSAAIDTQQHKVNVERRRQELALKEEQQSFFPFSDQHKRSTPSPFRKLLEQRKSQDLLRSANPSPDLSVAPQPTQLETSLQRSHACFSSESIYSRTTNGAANEDYNPRMGSSDDFHSPMQDVEEDTGMATIIPQRYQQKSSITPYVANGSEHEWKGWIQCQVDSLSKLDLSKVEKRTNTHYREQAQIDPDDVDIGSHDVTCPRSGNESAKQYPMLDLKQVSSHNTPVPKRNSSVTKSQSGLLKRISTADLGITTDKDEEIRKVSSSLRKISPGNIARILRERKSQILLNRHEDSRKENRPSPRSESPPLSTPGRLGLQMRSGNGRLRKRASESIFSSKDNGQPTVKKTSTPGRLRALENDESPTDRVKQSLSARLSRPFDTDVPELNRPFDSMYLGKCEIEQTAPGRLSVAPHGSQRGPPGYGGLGANSFDGERDTALPEMDFTESHPGGGSNKGGFAGLWNSKRMVSDFLKKRRARGSSEEKNYGGNPAFV